MNYLITFEGIDGVGKTTQIKLLQEFINQEKIKLKEQYLFTKNPGGTVLGKKIRELLLKDSKTKINSTAELFLYLSDRVEHFEQVIEKALQSKKTVICDRFVDSTVAYQSLDSGISKDLIKQLNLLATKNKKPDFTVLFDLRPEIALKRILKERKSTDKIESKGINFMKQVRLNFLEIAEKEKNRFIVINVENKSMQEIHQFIIKKFLEHKIIVKA